MKNPTYLHSAKRGFTLIELLVVIAIIAVLAAMGFGAGGMAINKAKKTHALKDCSDLVTSIQAFYGDYNTLPQVDGADTAPGVRTESTLMNQLVGFDEEANPKGVRYFQGRDAKGTSIARAYGGIYYEERNAELFDPWRKVTGNTLERRYFVMLDEDYDEEIADPFNSSGKPLYGRSAIAWCTGKDGKFSQGRETEATNRDNVYSWK